MPMVTFRFSATSLEDGTGSGRDPLGFSVLAVALGARTRSLKDPPAQPGHSVVCCGPGSEPKTAGDPMHSIQPPTRDRRSCPRR